MWSSILALGFGAVLADALAVRSCEFSMTAHGSINGPLGEISSGQIRAGGSVRSTPFEMNGNQLWDTMGHGCWWTPPTKLLQCDNNQAPAQGWTIDCYGNVAFKGQTEFWECDTSASGVHDVYLIPGQGVNCKQTTLTANGCHASCPPSSCPANLNGNYEFPHLIIPVDKSKPNYAPGTSYFGEVSSTISSIFNFDIPSSDAGKKCSLVFLFPLQSQLQTSSFTFSGTGGIDFKWLSQAATQATTYNNQPGVKQDLGAKTVSPGHSYVIDTFACPAGQAIAFEMSAVGDTCLRYFQDYNPAPIGLYITTC